MRVVRFTTAQALVLYLGVQKIQTITDASRVSDRSFSAVKSPRNPSWSTGIRAWVMELSVGLA